MAQSSSAPLSNSVSVIGPHYCTPHAVELGIVKKAMRTGNFVITNSAGGTLFNVKNVFLTFIHERRVILDAAGLPIVTLQRKASSSHSRWQVFRGESHEANNMIFCIKTNSFREKKNKLLVFFAHNTKEEVCDFRLEFGSWSDRSYKIYIGESSTIIAEAHQKHSAGSILLGKDKYMVTVHPNIDYAFIVTMIVVLHEITHESHGGGGGGGGGGDLGSLFSG